MPPESHSASTSTSTAFGSSSVAWRNCSSAWSRRLRCCSAFAQAIRYEPDYPPGHVRHGDALVRMGRNADARAAFERLTGWSREDWLGKPFTSISHRDDVPRAVAHIHQAILGEQPPALPLPTAHPLRAAPKRSALHPTPAALNVFHPGVRKLELALEQVRRIEKIPFLHHRQDRIFFVRYRTSAG